MMKKIFLSAAQLAGALDQLTAAPRRGGVIGHDTTPTDLGAVRALIEEQGRAFNEFKALHERQMTEVRQSGTASAETTNALAKANEDIQRLQTQLREVETQLNRPTRDSGNTDPQAEARRTAFLAFMRDPGDREARAALVQDDQGRLLVPEDLEAGIRRSLGKENIMRTLADVRPTKREKIRRRRMTEVTVGWGKLETGAALVESTPTPSEEFLYVEDMYGLVRIGEDELMDADEDLAATVEDSFGRATGEKEETAFVLGTGHASQQPEGFTLGATVTRVNAGQAGLIKVADILKLMYAVAGAYRRNGSFLVNSATELAMRLMTDTNGQLLWQPSLVLGTPAVFSGRPVYNQEDLVNVPAAGTAADVAAFGDWKAGYRIADRLGMGVKRLNELYATQGMVGFLAHKRVAGGVVEPAALRVLRVPAA